MRFQFCGNISCPEWFIAQISVLTKITAVKVKLVFAQLLTFYLDGSDISAKTQKLLGGTGLDIYETHAVIATLQFILSNAVMFQVTDTVLFKELVDLGLPKENVQSITKTYKNSREKLIEVSQQRGIKLSNEVELNYSIHELIGSSQIGSGRGVRFGQCELTYRDVDGEPAKCDFSVGEQQLDDLIYQLQSALGAMGRIQ